MHTIRKRVGDEKNEKEIISPLQYLIDRSHGSWSYGMWWR